MRRRVLITSALPYANGPLHFGHIAGAYLPADCYARFERMQGAEVLFISGSDEYGVAVTMSAEKAGRTPQAQVDFFHETNKNFFKKLELSFDHFSRTTTKYHAPFVQQFFADLKKNGYIEERETEELFSEKEQKFLADRYVVGSCPKCGFEEARGDECGKCGANYEAKDLKNPRSKMSGAPLELKKTRHFFLLFDRFKEELSQFLAARPWKANVVNFAKPYIEDIHPRAISRDLSWGVAIPGSIEKVFYVWFDAPIGYISATKEWAEKIGSGEKWKDYWLDPKTKYVQFIGKDNIPFHALFFPAMVMGQDQPYKLVDDLVANEFYNLEGRQFSKSEGWTIDLEDFFPRFQVDQIRYMLAATAPETGDAEFTWKEFQLRNNSELVGKLGNFVNRVLVFVKNNNGQKIPPQHDLEEMDQRFLNEIYRYTQDIAEHYSNYRLRKVCQTVMEFAHKANAYFDLKAPWKDAKEPKRHPYMENTLHLCLEAIKTLAITLYPLIPRSAEKMWEMVGLTLPLPQWREGLQKELAAGSSLPDPAILFAKIEDEVIAMEVEKLEKMHERAEVKKEPPYPPLKPEISIEDFHKVDLRVGIILEAEKLPKSKKLLKLRVDIGAETRTILSGISEHYSPEQLVGKKVVVVANLKPAKLMGVESQGMILAGSGESKLELLTIQDLPGGSSVS